MKATINKSQLFHSAWKLVKEVNQSMSEALINAWAAAKEDAKVFVSSNWKGVKSFAFTKGSSTAETIERLRELIMMRRPDQSGAAIYYGTGHYNGD